MDDARRRRWRLKKLDHLITRQWQRLTEIQRLQLEMMQERRRK